MTNSQSKVENTVPIGGNLKLRIQDVDITNYDDDGNGDGEAFAPSDVNMRRFVFVLPMVKQGQGGATTVVDCTAQYEYDAQAIRLFQQANDGTGSATDSLTEVPSNSNEGAEVRTICVGV